MPRIARIAPTIGDVIDGRARFVSICARVEDVEMQLPDGCANLMPIDGPYHGVKPHAWDNEHDDERAFLAWKRERYAAWKRILAPNGTLYDFASPKMGARVEVTCREHFEVLGTITWFKQTMAVQKCPPKCGFDLQRNFVPFSERIVVAEQYGSDSRALGESRYETECDKLRGFVFEPIRAYLDGERERAGFKRGDCDKATGNQMSGHYFSRVQWTLPTRENYEKLRAAFNAKGSAEYLRKDYEYLRKDYEYLRKDYEDLRKDYEDLRRPFSVTSEDQYTDVWTYATVPHRKGKHPCEKPADMARDIVRISSRPNDLVLVLFAGSGVFAVEALKQGRRVIAVDADPHWANITRERCEAVL